MSKNRESFQNNLENPNRELTPDEVKERLSVLKEVYCVELRKVLGESPVFYNGAKVGDVDISGKTLEEVLNMIMASLENYEPPITQKYSEEGFEKKKEEEIPVWLKGHEELIWKGAHDNPIWRANGQQFGNEVFLSYERKGRELKPGKNELEQSKKIEPIKNIFTVDEWKVAKLVFEKYEKLEKDLESEDEEIKKEAKKTVFDIIQEENAFRKGKGGVPKIISSFVSDSLEKVAKSTRGFKKESINSDGLIQQLAEVLSQLYILNRNRVESKGKVPRVKPDIKEIPSFEYSLELLAELLANQLNAKKEDSVEEGGEKTKESGEWYDKFENAKGVTLMIGEAGTGKNEAVEYFAAKTGRPFFWFPCGRGMEAVDLVTHYEFDSKEGTKKFFTELSEGIQTPGAIVFIDEVNALKQPVQAILHGLGDSNRSLNYDGVRIPVAEGVVIIIAGNPATYGSAGNLGQALISRTRGQAMVMDYPALRKGELLKRKEQWSDDVLAEKEQEDNSLRDYACDEVLVLYPLLNEFSGLKDEEFALLWDCITNESTQGERINEIEENQKLKDLLKDERREHIRKTLIDLRDILRIADEWRKKYEKRSGGFDIIGVSMRDTIAIVKAYKDERDVRKAYMKVFSDFRKNPIDGLDVVYKYLDKLVDDVLSK